MRQNRFTINLRVARRLMAFACCVAPLAHAASSPVRVDVTGRLDGKAIEIAPVNGEGLMKGGGAHWIKKGDPVRDLLFVGGKITEDWAEYSLSFTPAASGTVELHFCAQWHKDTDKRGWVEITDLRLGDEAMPNGNFTESAPDNKGVVMPKGYWLGGKSLYYPGAGPDGTGAVRVNHDNRMHKRLAVEAGQTYIVRFKARLADISAE